MKYFPDHIHTPFCATTSLNNTRGRIVGNILHLDKTFPRYIGAGALLFLDIASLLLPKAANKNTPTLDTALAFALGINETGPGAWFGGMDNIRSHSKSIPLSDTFSITAETKPDMESVALLDKETILFSRTVTPEGYSQTLNPFFEPRSWTAIEEGLATFIAPYSTNHKARINALCDTLNIPKHNRKQG